MDSSNDGLIGMRNLILTKRHCFLHIKKYGLEYTSDFEKDKEKLRKSGDIQASNYSISMSLYYQFIQIKKDVS